ncbi:MAG: sodium-dependent transporter [Gammaproteobacteria bacterium]
MSMDAKLSRQSLHGEWTSRWHFILAATGAAVGLGNIWKFPYMVGKNGGGAFVLFYMLCVALIGIPVMMAEIMVGRRGRRNPAHSMALFAKEANRSHHWQWVGYITIAASLLILSYYPVVAGWAWAYAFKSGNSAFIGANATSVKAMFASFIANPWHLIIWHTLVMLVTGFIVARGIKKGLERAICWLFPLMVAMLCVLVGYMMHSDFFDMALQFLFKPHFSQLTPHSMLMAMGQAFFSLSLATGSIMMYGAYLPQKTSIAQATIAIALVDTGIALLAGLAIFPIVFAFQLEPSAGASLIFQTLPIAFGNMPHGVLFGTLFFIMLVFAAITSSISFLEPSVAWLIETKQITRPKATLFISFIIWLLGLVTLLSFNEWKNITFKGLTIFQSLDYLTANIMLPLGGLGIALFVAWFVPRDTVKIELQLHNNYLFKTWYLCIRYFSIIAIVLVFAKSSGII